MSMIPEQKDLEQKYSEAPSTVTSFITSPELSVAFEDMRNTHKLHLDEAAALARALNAIFLGVREFSDFPEMLKEALDKHASVYDALLRDVNEKVFVVFKNKLKQGSAPSVEVDESAPTSTTPTIAVLEQKVAPTEAPITPTPNKLEAITRETPKEVEVSSTEEVNGGSSQANSYTNADPYREPI